MIRTTISLLFLAGLLAACSKQDEPKTASSPPPSVPPQIQLTVTNSPRLGQPVTTGTTNEAQIERGIEVRGAGNLYIKFPRSWADKISRVREHGLLFDSIIFVPRTNGDFQLMVDVNNIGQAAADRVQIKDVLQKAGQVELTNSVEKTLEIQEFQGPQVSGCYFVVTDRNYNPDHPVKGDFRYLTQGYAKIGPLILSLRLVSNELSPIQGQMLDMIKTTRLEKTAQSTNVP